MILMADEICREYCASRNSVKIPFDAFIIILYNMSGNWTSRRFRALCMSRRRSLYVAWAWLLQEGAWNPPELSWEGL